MGEKIHLKILFGKGLALEKLEKHSAVGVRSLSVTVKELAPKPRVHSQDPSGGRREPQVLHGTPHRQRQTNTHTHHTHTYTYYIHIHTELL